MNPLTSREMSCTLPRQSPLTVKRESPSRRLRKVHSHEIHTVVTPLAQNLRVVEKRRIAAGGDGRVKIEVVGFSGDVCSGIEESAAERITDVGDESCVVEAGALMIRCKVETVVGEGGGV